MLNFAAAFFLAIVTPGPGVLSTAATGAAFGFRAGLAYVAGLFVGTNLVGLAVISGLATAILANPALRLGLLILSGLYMTWLALRIGLAGSRIAFAPATRRPGPRDGILLQLINPKAYAVNTVFFSGFAFWPGSLATEVTLKLLIMNAIWVPLHLAWLQAGVLVHRLDLAPGHQRAINIGMALALVGVVALALVSLA